MNKVYILCGVPASGKSTWCQNNIPKDALYVSRDEVRFSMVKPNEPYFSRESEVFDEFINRIRAGIAAGKDVYADATHLNWTSRAKTMHAVGRENCIFDALVFNASLDGCLLRNSGRSGRTFVPEHSIEEMFHRFTIPTKNEGFNEIWIKEVDK